MQISDLMPGVNIIGRKVSIASINWAEGSEGCSGTPAGDFRGQSTLRNLLGSKEHLDWLKIDLNVPEIITVQKSTQKKLMGMEVHIIQCSS